MIVQGVYELFDKEYSTDWGSEARVNRMVFIGRQRSNVISSSVLGVHGKPSIVEYPWLQEASLYEI